MRPFVLRESSAPMYVPSPAELRRARGLSYAQRGYLEAAVWFALAAVVAWAWVL